MNKIYLVISLMKTTATLWQNGDVIQCWDYRTGKTLSQQFGWLMTFTSAQDQGAIA